MRDSFTDANAASNMDELKSTISSISSKGCFQNIAHFVTFAIAFF